MARRGRLTCHEERCCSPRSAPQSGGLDMEKCMTRFANRKSTALLITTIIATVVWVNAGSLAPPAGPVAPTMKPLDEIEPRIAIDAINTAGDAGSIFKVTQPGSYYLT